MKKIKCACGEEFENKKSYILHILSLGCFDENLEFKIVGQVGDVSPQISSPKAPLTKKEKFKTP